MDDAAARAASQRPRGFAALAVPIASTRAIGARTARRRRGLVASVAWPEVRRERGVPRAVRTRIARSARQAGACGGLPARPRLDLGERAASPGLAVPVVPTRTIRTRG